jgi:N-acetylglutamate synthase-like GNAT family acetyltransferase
MLIRKATNNDAQVIYDLHIASIKYYCSAFYPEASIQAWLNSKSIESYKNISEGNILLVAEEGEQIVGFGLLNLQKKTIDSLYIKPTHARKGYGRILLERLEKIAHIKKIDILTLSSTLNATAFYQHMGYGGNVRSTHKLLSGTILECVNMTKQITRLS